MNTNIAFVPNCGDAKIVIARFGEIYYAGCFRGSYKEFIKLIGKNYTGLAKDEYIAKVNLLKNSCLEDFKDITADNNAAIRWAAAKGFLDIVKYLHKNGADITARNNSAVCLAAKNGNLETVKYLHQNGADITANNNAAVCLAAENGYLEIVKYLHKNGADITVNNNYAFRSAVKNGHEKVVGYLRAKSVAL